MPTALIIEDDLNLRQTISIVLRTNGFHAVETDTSKAGVEIAQSIKPDLILCDIDLGAQSGFNALQSLKSDPAFEDIPFIMMTGKSDQGMMRKSMELGADDFLIKPFGSETLLSAINAQMRKHAAMQRKVDAAKARLLSVLEATPDFVATASPDGKILEINRAGLAMLDLEHKCLVHELSLSGFRPDGINLLTTTKILELACQHGIWEGESKWRGYRGRDLVVAQVIVAHRTASGAIDFISTTARDITENKRRAESLYLLDLAVQASGNGIAIMDARLPGYSVIYCNAAFRKDTGYTALPADVNLPFLEMFMADLEGAAGITKTFKAQEESRLVVKGFQRHGTPFWSELWLSPIKNAQGETTHFIAVTNNITQLREAEYQRKMLEVELREAQKLEAIGQMAAGIAHEINTPTQFIGDNTRFLRDSFAQVNPLLRRMLEVLKDIVNKTATSESAEAIQRQAAKIELEYLLLEIPQAIDQTAEGVDRVSRIVRAMKEFSHPGVREKTLADINRAIETTVIVARNVWKYVAEVEFDLDTNLPPTTCFPGEFNQVLLNLIVNAAHAIEDAIAVGRYARGCIKISTRTLDGNVEIRIADNGMGIPAGVCDRIFEPYFTTKAVGRGTGHGLAMSRSIIVDLHAGRISFETEPGVGTSFIVLIPLSIA